MKPQARQEPGLPQPAWGPCCPAGALGTRCGASTAQTSRPLSDLTSFTLVHLHKLPQITRLMKWHGSVLFHDLPLATVDSSWTPLPVLASFQTAVHTAAQESVDFSPSLLLWLLIVLE